MDTAARAEQGAAVLARRRERSQLRGALRLFTAHPTIVVAALIILANVAIALAAPWIAPFDPLEPDYSIKLAPPSLAHPFGADLAGRDVLSRVIWGGRVSLSVGLLAVAIGLTLGILIGLPAGYFGGWVDSLLMRLVDVMLTFPGFLLALVISAAIGPSIQNVMIAIGVASAPRYARLVRGSALTARTLDYITAAVALGANHRRVMIWHVLPNIVAPVIVYGTLQVSTAIITEASLSFLGFGVRPPVPSWGSVIADGRQSLLWAPWISTVPGVVISVTVICFNLLGDTFRDALDPRLRGEVSTR